MKSFLKKSLIIITSILVLVIFYFYVLLPDTFIVPVKGARKKDYDQNTFGAPRMGHSHKGVDIFAKKGTPVISATDGWVVFTGVLSLGGNVVLVMGPDMKSYYYAHLDEIQTTRFSYVHQGEQIGTVGKTGNARNTPAHLHFSISNTVPWRGKYYENPVPVLNRCFE